MTIRDSKSRFVHPGTRHRCKMTGRFVKPAPSFAPILFEDAEPETNVVQTVAILCGYVAVGFFGAAGIVAVVAALQVAS